MGDIEADDNAGGKPRTAQKSLVQGPKTTDYKDNSCTIGLAVIPREAEEMGAAPEELSNKEKRAESYRPFANAMLATSTFAGTITLTFVLTPGNGTHVPGLTVLAYSSSIFIGGIMGCICMISSIELNMPFAFVRMEATILGLMLFSAFYLLLLASSLFLNHRGPFILGSILYLGFGVLLGMLSLADWLKRSDEGLIGKRLIGKTFRG
jgi:hypothetical protein